MEEPAESSLEEEKKAAMPTFKFNRYIDGILMAEGVTVGTVATLKDAMPIAARLAARGPRGQVPVLVLREIIPACDACPRCGRSSSAIRVLGHRPPCTRSTSSKAKLSVS